MTEEQRDQILLTILKNSSETKEKVERLEERVIKLEEKVERLEERVIKLEEKVERLEERVIKLEERVENLEERVIKLEENFQDSEENFQDLKSIVISIRHSVTIIEVEHGEKLDAIFSAISVHDDMFKIQNKRITKNEKDIEKYADKLYVLEQNLNK